MKISTLIRRVAITFVFLCVAFTLTAALVNLSIFDEDLRPEVSSILQPTQIPPHKNNAYTAIWGINAAADKDMVDTGVRLVERYHNNREVQGLDALTAEDLTEILGTNDQSAEWLEKLNCSARTQLDCVTKIRASLQSVPIASQRTQLLLDRHQHILQMSNFANWGNSSYTATTPLPPYAIMMNLSKLKLTRHYDSESSAAFLRQLSIDMPFWRMMLDQGSELIDKMVGIAGIWNDLQFLSGYMATHELTQNDVELVMSILKPLTENELNLEEAFKAEQRTLSQTLTMGTQSLSDFGPLVRSWLIQTNATQNSYYQYVTEPIIHLSGLSAAEFAAQTHLNTGSRKPYGRDAVDAMTTIWPGTLYNLGGKIFLSKMLGYPADYIARVHDLNSMISLVKLQLSLLSKEVGEIEHIVNTLDSGNSQFSEELAVKALRFDPKEGWLQFDCLYGRSICKIRLYQEKTY